MFYFQFILLKVACQSSQNVTPRESECAQLLVKFKSPASFQTEFNRIYRASPTRVIVEIRSRHFEVTDIHKTIQSPCLKTIPFQEV